MKAFALSVLLMLSGCVVKKRSTYHLEIDQARTIGYLEAKANVSQEAFVDRILIERCGETWGEQ